MAELSSVRNRNRSTATAGGNTEESLDISVTYGVKEWNGKLIRLLIVYREHNDLDLTCVSLDGFQQPCLRGGIHDSRSGRSTRFIDGIRWRLVFFIIPWAFFSLITKASKWTSLVDLSGAWMDNLFVGFSYCVWRRLHSLSTILSKVEGQHHWIE